MTGRGGIAFALLLAAACTAPPPPDPWTLKTIDTLASPEVIGPGGDLPFLRSPYPPVGSKTGKQQATQAGLTVFPAFSEGKPAAYMTTEVWENFDEVWAQPLYVDVTGHDAPIFGIDASSRFYSPYWQILLYSHPAGAPEFRDARAVLDSKVTLSPNSAKYCAITRNETVVAAIQQGDATPLRPLNGDPVTAPRNSRAYAAGNEVYFVDLGNAQRFTFDPVTLVVEETPLYAFALPDANGFPVEVDLPRVGGTGPPHNPRCDGKGNCAGVIGGIPEFGSLWRVYDVLLPAGADVYVPANLPDLQAAVRAMGFTAPAPATSLGDDFTLRVAVNGKTCLPADPTQCIWLDSQNQIESQVVEWRVTQTGTTVSCPLVEFNGKPVPFR